MLYVLAVSRGDGPFADGVPAPAAVVAEGARFSAAPVAGAQPVRLVKPRDVMAVGSAAKLSDLFSGMGYHLDRVRQRDAAVPGVFLANLPPDLKTLNSIATRKTVFLRTMLPLVLSVNESILLERGRLLAVRQRLVAGRRLGRVDRDWVEDLSRRYPNFEYTIVLWRPLNGWTGLQGPVTEALEGCLPADADVYLCGPPAMVAATSEKLGRLGVPEERITAENIA